MLRSKLNDALKHSVKNKDKIAVSTLRLILAALKDRDIAHRTVDADDDGVGAVSYTHLTLPTNREV